MPNLLDPACRPQWCRNRAQTTLLHNNSLSRKELSAVRGRAPCRRRCCLRPVRLQFLLYNQVLAWGKTIRILPLPGSMRRCSSTRERPRPKAASPRANAIPPSSLTGPMVPRCRKVQRPAWLRIWPRLPTWPQLVEVAASQEIMRNLFELSASTQGDVLAKADRSLMDAKRPYQHPYYWAAFSLVGDGARPMPTHQPGA
jgi:hypothetical protein